ncbi:thermonuclease family protein [Rhodoferax ferrireducens]|uniref:thermonuclease family protein n=1 Tax=Rhodoferax ferrireducens TaxID=192843 RepID=UPI000E0DFA67|nr:thermonuclease family protein [Rhodoferax ferrireducens]
MQNHNKTTSAFSGCIRLTVTALALLLSLSAFGFAGAGSLVSGKVIGVLDGDTVEVLDARKTIHRIRLTGIDAPEKAQPFGQRSKEHLSDLVFGKQVDVQAGKSDRYGRTVGKVLVKGVDANLEQVKSGFAWHYKEYSAEQPVADRALYARAENSAHSSHFGIWRDANPMPPWEWRHGGKNIPTWTSIASGCPCSGESHCTGPKGGHFCISPTGKKRYQ